MAAKWTSLGAAAAAGAAATIAIRAIARRTVASSSRLTIHVYDHCPFCVRIELLAGALGIEYDRVVYGYGEGADPTKCGGTGYGVGPVALTGKKMLPVITGAGVPKGGTLGESLEIASFLCTLAPGCAPATGRGDVADWLKKIAPISSKLTRPRLYKMPVKDWANEGDVAYARWKYSVKMGFDYAAAEAATPELVVEAASIISELAPLLKGGAPGEEATLNEWGFSIDDVLVLPVLRNLTAVKGLTYAPEVQAYLDDWCKATGVETYAKDAL
eukprot:CAMPEP_0182566994 /NCGR_PEP_ID=MMETSP1324-20130603/8320_1 /TAXON_ID=236786 /ORGANISM="Florenciella sp., Strain RCC1587" /LENGTH=271 /DNA_ID=CAMNT_0024780899 /DNA_START=20 /DNA_END=835 /DNA_ORIENTATION=-